MLRDQLVEAGTKRLTGASSGIGLELARCFAGDGYALIITPMTVRSSSRPRAIFAQRVRPDFLVNDAGRGVYGGFVRETDLDAELRMIQLAE